jgi:hypothetical protein
MTKSKYLDEINTLLAGSDFERFKRSPYMNAAATAFVLGVKSKDISKIMQGRPKIDAGEETRYLKSDVYEAMRGSEIWRLNLRRGTKGR